MCKGKELLVSGNDTDRDQFCWKMYKVAAHFNFTILYTFQNKRGHFKSSVNLWSQKNVSNVHSRSKCNNGYENTGSKSVWVITRLGVTWYALPLLS